MFTPEKFGTWKTSSTREKVHKYYLDSPNEVGIKEADVHGGARVHDRW